MSKQIYACVRKSICVCFFFFILASSLATCRSMLAKILAYPCGYLYLHAYETINENKIHVVGACLGSWYKRYIRMRMYALSNDSVYPLEWIGLDMIVWMPSCISPSKLIWGSSSWDSRGKCDYKQYIYGGCRETWYDIWQHVREMDGPFSFACSGKMWIYDRTERRNNCKSSGLVQLVWADDGDLPRHLYKKSSVAWDVDWERELALGHVLSRLWHILLKIWLEMPISVFKTHSEFNHLLIAVMKRKNFSPSVLWALISDR